MDIEELRQRNNIKAPHIDQKTPTSEPIWNREQSADTRRPEEVSEDTLKAETFRASIPGTWSKSNAEDRVLGAGPGAPGTDRDITGQETVNRMPEDSFTSAQADTEDMQNRGIEQQATGPSVGTFGDDDTGQNIGESIISEPHSGMSWFERLPYLWEVDLVCILLTIAGVTAIVMNLSAVLAFIFEILYSIINFIFVVIFCISLTVGAVTLLFRRRPR